MKKILALLLAVVFVFALASCGAGDKLAGKTAKEALEISDATMDGVKALKTDMTITIGMSLFGQTMNMEVSSVLSVVNDEKNPAFSGTMTLPAILGPAEPTELVYVDGILYTKSGDTKVKAALSAEEALAQTSSTGDIDFLSFFAAAKIEKKDGKYVLTADTVPAELLESLDLPVDADTESLKINKMETVMTPDGFVESVTIDLEANASGSAVTVVVSMKYEKLADSFKVTAPADADTYIDSDFDLE